MKIVIVEAQGGRVGALCRSLINVSNVDEHHLKKPKTGRFCD